MRKKTIFLLAVLHLGLWSVFLLNQFGLRPIWASKEENKEEEVKEEVSSSAETTEIEKSTPTPAGTPVIPDKKPEGMSDLEWEKLKAKKPMAIDKGPSTIEVSKYPKEMQDIYKNIYIKTCSKCHTIARAINAPYVLPEEWKAYIKKMMSKPGSGINPNAAKKIYEFSVYDSGVRKKDLLEKKLKEKTKK